MFFSSLLLTTVFAANVFASPFIIPHSVHEKRDTIPYGWRHVEKLDQQAIIPLRIGLVQNNLDKGGQWLNEVSHPKSPRYGHHWTAKEVAEAFAPANATVNAVRNWLVGSGIAKERISYSQSLGFLDVPVTIDEAEELLKTQYHLYEHASGRPHIACDEYSIPTYLQQHVDFITPTLHFDVQVSREPTQQRSDPSKVVERAAATPTPGDPGAPNFGSTPKLGYVLHNKSEISKNLANCSEQITPPCLRALYEIPINTKSASNNSLGIVEYTPQAYVPADLDLFFTNFSKHQIGNRPILDSIDGGVVQQNNMSFNFNGESDLDLEYAMTLVYPQNVTLYQAGDLVEGASFNNFLDAIDASYCTYEGGDSERYDEDYPDPYPGGYNGPQNCGGFAATKVISSSYSYNEHDLTPHYERRQCHEYMKLGLMGVTVVYASGDYGVEGSQGTCINGTGQDAPYIAGANGGRFNPSFPGSCPYVTAVGATQVKPNTSVPDAMASGTEPEQACETKIYSGGGFSNVFKLPQYQTQAVGDFFTNYPPPYGADQYNNSRMTRGLPDVSSNGAGYLVAYDSRFGLAYGTSAAAPTFASIITLINQARLLHNKSTVGFINPVAYAHPEIFNDITEGSNPGCATAGFQAQPGWDPVTGLGTPNYPKMKQLWLSLA